MASSSSSATNGVHWQAPYPIYGMSATTASGYPHGTVRLAVGSFLETYSNKVWRRGKSQPRLNEGKKHKQIRSRLCA